MSEPMSDADKVGSVFLSRGHQLLMLGLDPQQETREALPTVATTTTAASAATIARR